MNVRPWRGRGVDSCWIWLGMMEMMVQEMGRIWMLREVGTIVSSNIVPGNYMLLLKHEQLKSYVKTAYKSIYANIKFNPTSSLGNPCSQL